MKKKDKLKLIKSKKILIRKTKRNMQKTQGSLKRFLQIYY